MTHLSILEDLEEKCLIHPKMCDFREIENIFPRYLRAPSDSHAKPIDQLSKGKAVRGLRSFSAFTCTKYSSFYFYSQEDVIPTKLFTWQIKINIPQIFQFACSHADSDCLVSLCTMHRADSKQARGRAKSCIDSHIPNAL